MKKIFISQPMRGKTDNEILKERNYLTELAKKQFGDNIEILDTFFEGPNFYGKNSLYYLAKSLEKLSEADIAIFAQDWHAARGCVIEYNCCKSYNIQTIEL